MRLAQLLLLSGIVAFLAGCGKVAVKADLEAVNVHAKVDVEAEPMVQPLRKAAVKASSYYVLPGDCLWSISADKLGDPFLWPAIWHANRDQVVNPDLIEPGQRLTVKKPSKAKAAAARREAASRKPYRHK